MKWRKFALAALIQTAMVFIALVVLVQKIDEIPAVWIITISWIAVSVFVLNACILAIVYGWGQKHAISKAETQ